MVEISRTPISIDVISDIVCPWCFLGKRRLEAALGMTPEVEATVRWKPFRLDPTIPPDGIPRRDYLERKFGSLDAVQPMHDQLEALGQQERIDFRFDLIERSPSSVDAHRLIRWCGSEGSQDAAVERLFQAYFTEGQDIGDAGVLAAAAEDAGLDPQEAAKRLATDQDRKAVEDEIDNAYAIGVSGVPCFIIDSRYAVMGAQEAHTLARALSEAAASRTN